MQKVRFRRVKGYVWGGETWSLARSTLRFRSAKDKRWENEEWWMKIEESNLTDFNLYFITFPRQHFVGIFHIIFPTKENASGIIIYRTLQMHGSLQLNCGLGIMGICKGIFEFWPQKTGGVGHERVTRSKKRRFLRFSVMRWLTDGYADIEL